MDSLSKMRRMRMLEKMQEYPEMARRLGLKNRAYLKKETERGDKKC